MAFPLIQIYYCCLLSNIQSLQWTMRHLSPGASHSRCLLPPWCPPLFLPHSFFSPWPFLNTLFYARMMSSASCALLHPSLRCWVSFLDSGQMSLSLSFSMIILPILLKKISLPSHVPTVFAHPSLTALIHHSVMSCFVSCVCLLLDCKFHNDSILP